MNGLTSIVLGATSRIAQDYIQAAARSGSQFELYARRKDAVIAFLREAGLPETWAKGTLEDFGAWTNSRHAQERTAIINFVGVGDPAKAVSMGTTILSATSSSDLLALDYIDRFPPVRYVFFSSGAVYGASFDLPVSQASHAIIPINTIMSQDYYGISKLYAETMHRARADRSIIDLRVFNYASDKLDIDARFLITDIARAIRDNVVLETSGQEITRDYLGTADMVAFIDAAIAAPPMTNGHADAFSRAPISKSEMLSLMADTFGLRHSVAPAAAMVNATGSKPHYYSLDRTAEQWGYRPRYSSAEVVQGVVRALLNR